LIRPCLHIAIHSSWMYFTMWSFWNNTFHINIFFIILYVAAQPRSFCPVLLPTIWSECTCTYHTVKLIATNSSNLVSYCLALLHATSIANRYVSLAYTHRVCACLFSIPPHLLLESSIVCFCEVSPDSEQCLCQTKRQDLEPVSWTSTLLCPACLIEYQRVGFVWD